MATNAGPGYLWQGSLTQAMSTVPVNLLTTPCPVLAPALGTTSAVNVTDARVTDANSPAGVTPINEVQATAERGAQADAAQPDAAVPESAITEVADPGVAAGEGTFLVPGQSVVEPGGHSALFWMGLGLLLAVLLLATLAAVVWWLRRPRPALVEPPPSLLQDAPPRFFRRGGNAESPAVESAPEPTDCVLEISGNLPNGTPFQASCNVRSAAVDALIGRSGCDISIDSQDIQRSHARISGTAKMLTITDLGSTRGTWINRVPCLKGEIMFIGIDDLIFLGDVSFRVAVRPH
jgi:hypothetical protein